MNETLTEGLQIALFGMMIVFLSLYLLAAVLRVFQLVFYKNAPQPEGGTGAAFDEQEEVLVISAIMAEIMGDSEYILNIKEVD